MEEKIFLLTEAFTILLNVDDPICLLKVYTLFTMGTNY